MSCDVCDHEAARRRESGRNGRNKAQVEHASFAVTDAVGDHRALGSEFHGFAVARAGMVYLQPTSTKAESLERR